MNHPDPAGSTLENARSALREGQAHILLEIVETLPLTARRRIGRALIPSARAALAAPGGAEDPDHWNGELDSHHGDAADVVRLIAASGPAAAAKLNTLDLRVARDMLPRLFPGDLPVFVEEWSTRFARRPRAVDANRGIEAMFDWAHRDLVPPPTQQGAVLALISWAPQSSGAHLLRYLEARPVLIRTTLPLLFQVPGVKGASAAQTDESNLDRHGHGLRTYVIPALVRQGHWSVEELGRWCEDALRVPRSEYEYRWFRALREDLAHLHGPGA